MKIYQPAEATRMGNAARKDSTNPYIGSAIASILHLALRRGTRTAVPAA